MRVWIRQHHNSLIDSFRYGERMNEGARIVVICPDTDNVLIDCSRAFYEAECRKRRILDPILTPSSE
jgi:hypothetical protein